MTTSVLQVLDRKGHHVETVPEETPVDEIARLLSTRHIGGVPVTDRAGTLQGLVSERTLVTVLTRQEADFGHLLARDVMMRNVPVAALDDDIAIVARRMTDCRTRHVPVLEGGAIVGLVSIGDLVKFRLDEAAARITSLQHYITSDDAPGSRAT